MAGLAERFWSKVEVGHPLGCWLWVAADNGVGYGAFWDGNRQVSAHRWAYEALVGPIPEGLVLDHLCRTRHCVNPDHLEPVTPRENVMRGNTLAAKRASQVSCHRGHPYDEKSTDSADGRRRCRACKKMTDAARHARSAA